MTETAFHILPCLREPNHGCGIAKMVESLTGGEVKLAPGTMYGSPSKMTGDGLIRFVRTEDIRNIYEITVLGGEVQIRRIGRLHKTAQEAMK